MRREVKRKEIKINKEDKGEGKKNEEEKKRGGLLERGERREMEKEREAGVL